MSRLQLLSPDEWRQKISGLIDPAERHELRPREEIRRMCIRFVSLLPSLFGDQLDRKTMWSRIATGLDSAFAKTPGDDVEFFMQSVLTHICADADKASKSDELLLLIRELEAWSSGERQAWITYFHTHLIPIVAQSRNQRSVTQQRTRRKTEYPQVDRSSDFLATSEEDELLKEGEGEDA